MISNLPTTRAVDVSLEKVTQFPTRAGFGTLLLITAEQISEPLIDLPRVISFAGMKEIASSWSSSTEIYKKAQVAFSQEPSPLQIKVAVLDLDALVAGGDTFLLSSLDMIEGIDSDWYAFSICQNVYDAVSGATSFHPRDLFVGTTAQNTGGYYSVAEGGVFNDTGPVTETYEAVDGSDPVQITSNSYVTRVVNQAAPEALATDAFILNTQLGTVVNPDGQPDTNPPFFHLVNGDVDLSEVGLNSVNIPADETMILGVYQADYNTQLTGLTALETESSYTLITRMVVAQEYPNTDFNIGDILIHSISVNGETGEKVERIGGMPDEQGLFAQLFGEPRNALAFFSNIAGADGNPNDEYDAIFIGLCIPTSHLFFMARAITEQEVIQVEDYINANL